MFEDSLVMSRVEAGSPRTRWFTAGSLLLQGTVAICWIAIPLLRPEKLQFEAASLKPLPTLRLMEPKHEEQSNQQKTTASAMTILRPVTLPSLTALPKIHTAAAVSEPTAAPTSFATMNLGAGSSLPGAVLAGGTAERVLVSPVVPQHAAGGHLRLSSGVGVGMLLSPIRPTYPQIAALSHVEGAVVVEAVISKAGAIERAHVVSGPALLQQAALAAVLTARYRPFLLNGEPTEVETRFIVNFRLRGGA